MMRIPYCREMHNSYYKLVSGPCKDSGIYTCAIEKHQKLCDWFCLILDLFQRRKRCSGCFPTLFMFK